jgi:hypothetical protein
LEHCNERNELERAIAGPLRFGPEVRLACQTKVSGDLKLRRLVLDETDLEITSQLAKPRLGRCGETKAVAVLFCDIRDFTNLSQHLSPYDLIRKGEKHFACNNCCPHMHLPFFEKRDAAETGVIKSPD